MELYGFILCKSDPCLLAAKPDCIKRKRVGYNGMYHLLHVHLNKYSNMIMHLYIKTWCKVVVWLCKFTINMLERYESKSIWTFVSKLFEHESRQTKWQARLACILHFLFNHYLKVFWNNLNVYVHVYVHNKIIIIIFSLRYYN